MRCSLAEGDSTVVGTVAGDRVSSLVVLSERTDRFYVGESYGGRRLGKSTSAAVHTSKR